MASNEDPGALSLGPVLVFPGFHLIKALLKEPDYGPVFALSRNPSVNVHPEATYHACDITDANALTKLLDEIKPRVVFHTASPRHADFSVRDRDFHDTNIQGTKNLLSSATATPSVKAFVHTSSVSVLAGDEQLSADEDAPLWQSPSQATPYEYSKAAADVVVREGNCEALRTVNMRTCLILGERDNSYVPLWMDAPSNMQIGNNENVIDCVSVDNAVAAHLLAAKALLNPALAHGKVDGESFNITDDKHVRFWDISRLIWAAAGTATPVEKITVLPAWLALIMAGVAEWLFLIFTLGRMKPEKLNKLVVLYCIKSHTYNIDKARKVLGYEPVPYALEDTIRSSVEWEKKRRAAKKQESKKE